MKIPIPMDRPKEGDPVLDADGKPVTFRGVAMFWSAKSGLGAVNLGEPVSCNCPECMHARLLNEAAPHEVWRGRIVGRPVVEDGSPESIARYGKTYNAGEYRPADAPIVVEPVPQ